MKKKAFKKQFGVSLIHFTVALLPLLAIGGFAVDFGNALVSQTELQNAADAGALEGARQLYNGTSQPNENVGQCYTPPCTSTCFDDPACNTASANFSSGSAVEVISSKRGHWTFTEAGATISSGGIERGGFFTPNSNENTAPTWNPATGEFRPLVDKEMQDPVTTNCSGQSETANMATDVNRDTCDINAVEVCVRNTTTSYLAKLLGLSKFENTACAVAYIGFAGSINPFELDAPIALCKHLLIQNGTYHCSVGRWSTSSANDEGAAKWTGFDQEACNSPGNNTITDLVDDMSCGGGPGINTEKLHLGAPIGVLGTGVSNSSYADLFSQWQTCVTARQCSDEDTSTFPTQPWTLRLPVIDCNNTSNSGTSCDPLFSAVSVQVIWMNDNISSNSGIPECMEGVDGFSDWDPDNLSSKNRWGGRIVPDTQTACQALIDSGENYAWHQQNQNDPGRCIDKNTYQINGETIYSVTLQNNGNISPSSNPYERNFQVWDSFIRHFHLSMTTTDDCSNASHNCGWWSSGYRNNTMYFSPKCEPQDLGGTGGTVTFVRARVPVLVY